MLKMSVSDFFLVTSLSYPLHIISHFMFHFPFNKTCSFFTNMNQHLADK